MNREDREETRQMIQDLLTGLNAQMIARDDVINIRLDEILNNVKRINGTLEKHDYVLSEHEKMIRANLPHTKAQCTQEERIKKIEAELLTEKTFKKTLYIGFGIIASMIAAGWAILDILMRR